MLNVVCKNTLKMVFEISKPHFRNLYVNMAPERTSEGPRARGSSSLLPVHAVTNQPHIQKEKTKEGTSQQKRTWKRRTKAFPP